MKAKKISHTNTNPVIEDEIKTAKKELDIKYEKMNYLKDQIKKNTTDELNGDLKLRMKEQGNQIYSLDQ